MISRDEAEEELKQKFPKMPDAEREDFAAMASFLSDPNQWKRVVSDLEQRLAGDRDVQR